MDNFFELEKKCKKLKRKKFIKISIYIVLIIITIIALLQLYKKPKITTKHIQNQTIDIKTKIKKSEKKPKETNKSLQINNSIEINKSNSIEINKSKKITTKEKTSIKHTKEINKSIKKSINIPTLSIQLDLTSIKSQKPKTQNKKLQKLKKENKPLFKSENISFLKAIQLAKTYYDNEDYKNAIKWCKIASNIDNEDERVWKYYALSLEKIGQKQKAIKILKTYLKYKNSIELKYILQRLSQ